MAFYQTEAYIASTVVIPTLRGDPNTLFVAGDGGAANCYAYALNLYGVGSQNPGYSVGAPTHGAFCATADFRNDCAQDGMKFNSDGAPVGPLFVTGEHYMAALFGSAMDMHWARVDSLGNWSDKMPGYAATYSEFQNEVLRPHEVKHDDTPWKHSLNFVAYFWVYPGLVAERYAAYVKDSAAIAKKMKKSKCVIL